MSALDERPIAAATMAHPTPCPSWCKDRNLPVAHHFGPTSTAHFSLQVQLPNPRPLPGTSSAMLRAELYRGDENDRTSATTLYVQGETDTEMTADEADIFIIHAQAFVDSLRALRRWMN